MLTSDAIKVLKLLRGANGWVAGAALQGAGIKYYRQAIYRLREEGYTVPVRRRTVNGLRVAEYRLLDEPPRNDAPLIPRCRLCGQELHP